MTNVLKISTCDMTDQTSDHDIFRFSLLYSSGQKSPPWLISASICARCLRICVHILRQECRSETKFYLDFLSKKRIIMDSTYICLEFFTWKRNVYSIFHCFLPNTELILDLFSWNWSSVYCLSSPKGWVHLLEYWYLWMSPDPQRHQHNDQRYIISHQYAIR